LLLRKDGTVRRVLRLRTLTHLSGPATVVETERKSNVLVWLITGHDHLDPYSAATISFALHIALAAQRLQDTRRAVEAIERGSFFGAPGTGDAWTK
jgi:hypothetical protein